MDRKRIEVAVVGVALALIIVLALVLYSPGPDAPAPTSPLPTSASPLSFAAPLEDLLDPVAFLPLAARNYDPALALPPIYPDLTNPGFEDGVAQSCRWWDFVPGIGLQGPFVNCYQEQRTPRAWTAWYLNRNPCPLSPAWVSGRPEYKIIDASVDPRRVHGGTRAAQWFLSWRCLEGGLFQRVRVTPGRAYQLSAYVQGSHTNCSRRSYDPPLYDDCETPMPVGAGAWLRIGLDGSGGGDPLDPGIVWTPWFESYGNFLRISTPQITAHSSVLTVWIEAMTGWPAKHNDAWIDDVALRIP